MTQIELLPCPFCAGRAELIACGPSCREIVCTDCKIKSRQRVLRNTVEWLEATMVEQWNTRTPSPASPARSDTREQAAASPSAVGEGPWNDPILAEWSIVGMNHYHVGGERRLFVAMTKRSRCIVAEGADEHAVFLRLREAALSSQAPKPASAGGERVTCIDCRGGGNMLHPEGDSVCTRCGGRGYTIAAEADTAKPIACSCDGIAKIHVRGGSAHCIHYMDDDPSRPDRLAPIEARGAVTYAEISWACISYDHAAGRPVRSGLGDPKRMRAALEAFLRARESAPAVERNGWVLMPRQPTQEMLDAASASQDRGDWIGGLFFARAWPHMLAAAPHPPK